MSVRSRVVVTRPCLKVTTSRGLTKLCRWCNRMHNLWQWILDTYHLANHREKSSTRANSQWTMVASSCGIAPILVAICCCPVSTADGTSTFPNNNNKASHSSKQFVDNLFPDVTTTTSANELPQQQQRRRQQKKDYCSCQDSLLVKRIGPGQSITYGGNFSKFYDIQWFVQK